MARVAAAHIQDGAKKRDETLAVESEAVPQPRRRAPSSRCLPPVEGGTKPGHLRNLHVATPRGTVDGTTALPLGFLEEIASGIDGYEGPVALEAHV